MKIGVIGGSGVYDLDLMEQVESLNIETPFGMPSSHVDHLRINGSEFYFITRHGKGHHISPSDINYRANIYALKSLGVTHVISISAVGSLKEEVAPGDFFLPDQFIDWTKGLRKRSFFENGIVGHVSVAGPIEMGLVERIKTLADKIETKFHFGGSYICIEGPQYSSRAESELFRSFGASVIGMTNVPESYLAKEAGMAYATVALVTDYDCWKDEACSLEEITNVINKNVSNVKELLIHLIPSLVNDEVKFERSNENAIVTEPSFWPKDSTDIIKTLIS
ncbi:MULTISPECIES: S-methyl-5'-thioadenosine phosphorylase [Pseudomonadati]|uniref:S-methyl-5'-thioadenosine phosphorylase n=1 Tax=unclassified Halobacteriovorax TaxID=2639665 RepID=UPI000CD0D53A|nr:S-methyl-5'-thioadenosine phosphorylase [Halobacteriovorax sp. DA5]POB13465.1 S-methyl-5'-thioadenosine phosphorylase [Halobacteriovorax sp. DA5]